MENDIETLSSSDPVDPDLGFPPELPGQVDVTCNNDASRRKRRQRRRHRPPRPQSGTIFTESRVILILWLARTARSLVMKTYAATGTPVEILHTLTGPSTHRRPAKTTPRWIWTRRQIRGCRDPSCRAIHVHPWSAATIYARREGHRCPGLLPAAAQAGGAALPAAHGRTTRNAPAASRGSYCRSAHPSALAPSPPPPRTSPAAGG